MISYSKILLEDFVEMNVKKTKKNAGFTLVEIIVVLVILAILAAAMIPAMLGYVEESRGKTYADQARVVYNAAQTCATEASALGATNAEIETALNGIIAGTEVTDGTAKSVCLKITNLIGADVLASSPSIIIKMSTGDGAIAGSVAQVYYDSNGTSTEGGYKVQIDVPSGTTNVEKDSKSDIITWPTE